MPLSALRSPLSALRSPVSGLRSPVSGPRSPLSGLRSPLLFIDRVPRSTDRIAGHLAQVFVEFGGRSQFVAFRRARTIG
jgi:hypothetical protein